MGFMHVDVAEAMSQINHVRCLLRYLRVYISCIYASMINVSLNISTERSELDSINTHRNTHMPICGYMFLLFLRVFFVHPHAGRLCFKTPESALYPSEGF